MMWFTEAIADQKADRNDQGVRGSMHAALAMMGFVFGWPLQGLLATSGIIAMVLGLARQSTLLFRLEVG